MSKGCAICTAIVVIIDAAGTALLQVFSIFTERNVPGGLPPSPQADQPPLLGDRAEIFGLVLYFSCGACKIGLWESKKANLLRLRSGQG